MDLGLPPVVAILTANTTEFMAKMGEAGAAMGGLEAEGGGKLATLGKVGGLALAAIGAAAVGIGAYSIDAASKFDSAMELIHTQAGASQSEVDKLKGAVLGLAPAVGQGPDQLADALYHIESNGLRGKQAMDVLKMAAEGATIGHADLVDTTNALTAAINSGIPGVQNYSQAMGALNSIVGSGDMQMQDLNEAFGTGIVVVAKQFGNSLNDVGAALATFGDNNIRGAKAGTELRMAIMDLAQQSKPGQAELAKFGITAGELAADMRKGGLGAALVDLKDKLTKAGITGSQVGDVLTAAFTKKSAAPLAILVDQLSRFQSKQELIRQGAGQFGDDWTATTKTFAFQMKQLEATVQELAVKLGEWLIPKVDAVAAAVADVVRWFTKHTEAAKMLGVAIAGALVPALVAFTINMAIATAAMLASPITWITLAVAALAVGIYELATHWSEVWTDIKKWADDAWKFLTSVFDAGVKFVKSHWQDMVQVMLVLVTGGLATIPVLIWHYWSQITEFTSQLWRDVTGYASRIWSDVSGFFTHLGSDVTTAVSRLWSDVTGFFTRMASDIDTAVGNGIQAVIGLFAGLGGNIFNAIGGLLDSMFNFGVNIIQKIIDGVGSMAGKVGSAIGGAIKSGINSIPGVGSLASAIGLAQGGKVTKPTLAIIGEGGEDEYVIPESWFRGSQLTDGGVSPLPSALGVAGQAVPSATAGPSLQIGGGGDLVVQVNGQDFVRIAGNDIWTWLLNKNRQTPTLAFK